MGTVPSWAALLVFILANCAAAASGLIFRPGQWYQRLNKPPWTPPNWLFGPAWTLLYATSAAAGYLVWLSADSGALALPLGLYALQLALNAAWSGIFFGMRRPDLAFGELVLMWLAIAATILAFWPIRSDAALLLLPYLAWVTFAGALNFSVWRRNLPVEDAAA